MDSNNKTIVAVAAAVMILLGTIIVSDNIKDMHNDSLIADAIIKTNDPIGVACALGAGLREICHTYVHLKK